MVRWIKLKEFDLSIDTTIAPSDEYVAACDGSLTRQEFRLRTDENGFMRSGAESHGGRPIIVLGDSASESLFIQERNRIGANIEYNLRKGGKNVDVLMNSMSNCTLLHSLNIYINKCIRLRPQAVIYMGCGSDAEALSTNGLYWISGEFESEKALNPIAEHRIGNDKIILDPVDEYERYRMLKVLEAVISIYGGRLILVTVPSRSEDDDYVVRCHGYGSEYYQKCFRGRTAINRVTRRFAEENDIILVDAERIIDQPDIFYDTIHLNEYGCGVVSDLISKAILGRVFI